MLKRKANLFHGNPSSKGLRSTVGAEKVECVPSRVPSVMAHCPYCGCVNIDIILIFNGNAKYASKGQGTEIRMA